MTRGSNGKVVIAKFLQGYCEKLGKSPPEVSIPDEAERGKKAIDAFATWSPEESVAIEHTLVQPFHDEQYKRKGEIGRIFEPLCNDASVVLPEHQIWLKVPLDGRPKDADRDEVAKKVRSWFLASRDGLTDGWSKADVPDLGFNLELTIYKQFLGHNAVGLVSVTYFAERVGKELGDVIRKALDCKLSKLLDFDAKTRFLLFEMNVRSYTSWDVRNHLDELKDNYRGLARVDAVWVVDTSEVDRQGRFFCTDVWPDDVGRRFFSAKWSDAVGC